MQQNDLRRLVFGALFTAIICVFTMILRLPSLGPGGYVNLGDTAVLLGAWMLGGWYGALAAGLGSGLADLLGGYAIYAPGSFLIKGAMAMAVIGLHALFDRPAGRTNSRIEAAGMGAAGHRIPVTAEHILTGAAAEVIMVAGYLLYEMFFLGYGAAALPAVLSNSIQGVTNLVIAVAAAGALENAKIFRAAA